MNLQRSFRGDLAGGDGAVFSDHGFDKRFESRASKAFGKLRSGLGEIVHFQSVRGSLPYAAWAVIVGSMRTSPASKIDPA